MFGQVMGLVALTLGFLALGAYIGRDLSGGWGILAFIASFGCIILTFQRLAQITSEDIAYAQRIARLREFYVDVAPRLEPYLTIVRGAAAAQRLRGARPHPGGWQLFLTLAGMVALVNSVIVGAAGAIMIDAITDDSLAPSIAVGVPVGILALLLHFGYLRRSQSAVDGDTHDEFAVVAPPSGPVKPRTHGPVG